jgi:uncharacterized protein with NRDE domain
MCLILLSFRTHRGFPLVVAANRDEHHARPAAPATFWPDHPRIYAGRDLEKGGTWMGISTTGRFAAITNFREGRAAAAAPRSRGAIVCDFLKGEIPAPDYLDAIAADACAYNPFSVIAGDLASLHAWTSGDDLPPQALAAGVHGLSNHRLGTPWPKVSAGVAALSATVDAGDADAVAAAMFAFLGSREPAPDAQLPDTGVGLQRERELSPPFISGMQYGTRVSTLLLVGADGMVYFHEKRYAAGGVPAGEDLRAFRLEAPLTV